MTPSDKANRQFWANRREERPKPPVRLSVGDFVSEANRRLRADRAWIPGTRFVVCTTDGNTDGEPSWEGPEEMRPLIQRIVKDMTTRFELPVPFRIERV
jgi:hypothetical protein